MIGVLIYFTVSILTLPVLWRMIFIREQTGSITGYKYRYSSSNRSEDLQLSFVQAMAGALFWPLALLVIPMYLWVARPTPIENQRSLEAKEHELRQEAKRLGLPWDVQS